MKALVTGGGGFLGLYLVEQLLSSGVDVKVFCRGRYPALDALSVPTVQGDLRDAAAVETACRGMDAVFHTAAVPGIWGSKDHYFGINYQGTLNILNACQRSGVARLIYTSSPSVVFDGHDHVDADESLRYPTRWLCHYPHSKAMAEQAVIAANQPSGLRTISLRPHLIWGPRDNHLIPRLIQRAASGRLRRVGDGQNMVSLAYVENAAAAHVQAEQALRVSDHAAGKCYFINDLEPVNLWAWIDMILEKTGLPPVRKSISSNAAYRIGSVLETVWSVLRLSGEPPMTRFVALQLAGSHSYCIDAAIRDFGYRPLVSIEEGLRRLQPLLNELSASLIGKRNV
ncbi:MAG: NAD-dependent epimerase/dehydratase family protein [Planctomycetaceae bacterium]|nr:NAD-dependent epimerase/dehydratase family protein [Planctomycetaceae bacterium]